MAYIATKATYIGEEEVKDENGKPVKKIKTDVDDVIFATGEVIVLIEEVNKGQHFDLSIEDKGSTYFAPTQIKIGDGIHSFQELNWLQTIDSNKIDTAVNNSVHKVVVPIISNFVNYQSKEILKELVSNNFFRINSVGGLIGFTTDSKEYAGKYCMSIGDNTSIEKTADGYTIGIGKNNLASSDYSLIIGTNNNSIYNYSYIFGDQNSSGGKYSFISGLQSSAGECSIACGIACHARGLASVSLGRNSDSYGDCSVSIGDHLIAVGENQTVFGKYNVDETEFDFHNLFIVGNGTDITNRSNAMVVDWNGNLSVKGGIMSIGDSNSVESSDDYGGGLLALGSHNTASGMYSVAIGEGNTASDTYASAIGFGNTASNDYSIAIGDSNAASGMYSIAIGERNTASGSYSLAFGMNNTANGSNSVCIGTGLTTSRDNQTVIGKYSHSSDDFAFAIGNGTGEHAWSDALIVDWSGNLYISGGIKTLNSAGIDSSSECLLSLGSDNTTSGHQSVALGDNLIASSQYQTVIGTNNKEDTSNRYIFIIGNGKSSGDKDRTNALTVDWDGNAVFAGDVTATMTDGSTISLIDIFNRIGTVEEQLATLVTPGGTA